MQKQLIDAMETEIAKSFWELMVDSIGRARVFWETKLESGDILGAVPFMQLLQFADECLGRSFARGSGFCIPSLLEFVGASVVRSC
jgi:hypothetical protein